MTSKCDRYNCVECGKQCLLAPYEPWDGEDPTGYYLRIMNEDQITKTIGALCKSCAFKLLDEDKLSMVGGGGLEPEFYVEGYEPRYIGFLFDNGENDEF